MSWYLARNQQAAVSAGRIAQDMLGWSRKCGPGHCTWMRPPRLRNCIKMAA